ncbi:hypothetical protein [Streptomyces alkaliphilus]|uniref:hypothetical protein n=1 Tax=Streptomyces alkaliphilus TaxID=1472722 RepID=UPI00117C4070|nr:hypothetical protein [Streptomyces alkaliphilus]MQS09193.1 hypothetical protein [Streptomyces alkaliphilus]
MIVDDTEDGDGTGPGEGEAMNGENGGSPSERRTGAPEMTRRGMVLLLPATVPLPWLLALVITLLWSWVWGGGMDAALWWTFQLAMVSAPLPVVVLVGVIVTVRVLRRKGRARPEAWWLVGGSAATLAFLFATVGGAIVDGEGGLLLGGYWVLLSGYGFFVFCGGAYAWSRPSVWHRAPGARSG